MQASSTAPVNGVSCGMLAGGRGWRGSEVRTILAVERDLASLLPPRARLQSGALAHRGDDIITILGTITTTGKVSTGVGMLSASKTTCAGCVRSGDAMRRAARRTERVGARCQRGRPQGHERHEDDATNRKATNRKAKNCPPNYTTRQLGRQFFAFLFVLDL